MRKIIKIILISFLTLNLSFTSFASDTKQGNDVDNPKLGRTIVPAESVESDDKPEENSKDQGQPTDKKDDNESVNLKPKPGKKEETNQAKPADQKNEDSAYKEKKENGSIFLMKDLNLADSKLLVTHKNTEISDPL